jgi:hypothetical protein
MNKKLSFVTESSKRISGLFHLSAGKKPIRWFRGPDVGDRVCVERIGDDVERGFIDFAPTG